DPAAAGRGGGGVPRERTALAEPDRGAAAARLVRGAGRRLRLLQHSVDGAHRRRGGRPTRLALVGDAAPGGPRADAALLAGVRGGGPPVRRRIPRPPPPRLLPPGQNARG